MKKHNFIATVIVMSILAIAFTLSGIAAAADQVVEAKIVSVDSKLDKNGNPYTRVVVEQQAVLGGVKYVKGIPMMAFGDANKLVQEKDLKPGDTIKAIASRSDYQGRTSYTIHALIE